MHTMKFGLVALVLVAGISSSAHAQGFATSSGVGYASGYYIPYGGFANPSGGLGNYALPGAYPYYGGYGYSGSIPGVNPGYITTFPNPYGGRVSSDMGGLMNSIRQQTGRPGSYRTGSNFGVSGNRRGR
jgi:hypothetical protein